MGLSDNERFNGICECIKEITNLPKFKNKKLNYLIGSLWPALLEKHRNSAHWILGGQLDNEVFNEVSLITAAFTRSKEIDYKLKEDEEYNTNLHYITNHKPTADLFFNNSKNSFNPDRNSYDKLFRLTESLMYYANRYYDEFGKSLRKVVRLVTKIQGICYNEFSRDPDYLAANLSEHIFNYILKSESDDVVTKWCRVHYLNHDLRFDDIDISELLSIFQECRKVNGKLPSERRMEIIFEFLKDRYHYTHQHQELYDLIEKHNSESNDKIDLNKIKSLCEKSKKMHDTKEKEPYYRFCWLTREEL